MFKEAVRQAMLDAEQLREVQSWRAKIDKANEVYDFPEYDLTVLEIVLITLTGVGLLLCVIFGGVAVGMQSPLLRRLSIVCSLLEAFACYWAQWLVFVKYHKVLTKARQIALAIAGMLVLGSIAVPGVFCLQVPERS